MREHGRYQIEVIERIVILRGDGAWNLETFQAYAQDVTAIGEQLKGEPWAVVIDARKWELAGLEVQTLLMKLAKKLDSLGRTHVAFVVGDDEDIIKFLVQSAMRTQSKVAIENFIDPPAAADWLEQNGFRVAELRSSMAS